MILSSRVHVFESKYRPRLLMEDTIRAGFTLLLIRGKLRVRCETTEVVSAAASFKSFEQSLIITQHFRNKTI